MVKKECPQRQRMWIGFLILIAITIGGEIECYILNDALVSSNMDQSIENNNQNDHECNCNITIYQINNQANIKAVTTVSSSNKNTIKHLEMISNRKMKSWIIITNVKHGI